MSEPGPICPNCGSWMYPHDIREDYPDGRIIGVGWHCYRHKGGCGFQYAEYPKWYKDEIAQREKEREEADRQAREREIAEWEEKHSGYVLMANNRPSSGYDFWYACCHGRQGQTPQEIIDHVRTDLPATKGYPFYITTYGVYRGDFMCMDRDIRYWYGKDRIMEGVL